MVTRANLSSKSAFTLLLGNRSDNFTSKGRPPKCLYKPLLSLRSTAAMTGRWFSELFCKLPPEFYVINGNAVPDCLLMLSATVRIPDWPQWDFNFWIQGRAAPSPGWYREQHRMQHSLTRLKDFYIFVPFRVNVIPGPVSLLVVLKSCWRCNSRYKPPTLSAPPSCLLSALLMLFDRQKPGGNRKKFKMVNTEWQSKICATTSYPYRHVGNRLWLEAAGYRRQCESSLMAIYELF